MDKEQIIKLNEEDWATILAILDGQNSSEAKRIYKKIKEQIKEEIIIKSIKSKNEINK